MGLTAGKRPKRAKDALGMSGKGTAVVFIELFLMEPLLMEPILMELRPTQMVNPLSVDALSNRTVSFHFGSRSEERH